MATATDAIAVMRSWLGLSRQAQTHRPIIDLYNSYSPLARGYKVTYWDDYCDVTVSAVFIKLNAVELIGGTECGVYEHTKIFQNKGIWKGNRNLTPATGWIIVYDFDGDGIGDHIGFVEEVNGSMLTCIEGNTSGGIVGRRTIEIGNSFILGYAVPAYEKEKTGTYKCELKTVKYGMVDKDVKVLQALLGGRGYTDPVLKIRPKIDGSFGDSTLRTFEAFQKKNNLKVKSECDSARWKKLLWR